MIEIDPKKQLDLIHSEVNLSTPESQLKSFFQLFSGLVLTVVISVSMLFLTAELVVELLPASWEDKIHLSISKWSRESLQEDHSKEPQKENQRKEIEIYLQGLVDELKMGTRLMEAPLKLSYVSSEELNAWAVPGYQILVTEGLYKKAESENEVAMILAHELGHFDLRHTMKNSARSLIIMVLSIFLSEQEAALSLADSITNSIHSGYSRKQEEDSDAYALELISQIYGQNSSGVLDFFERLGKKENRLNRAMAYLSTHPSSTKRVNLLKERIRELGMSEKGKRALKIPWKPLKEEGVLEDSE